MYGRGAAATYYGTRPQRLIIACVRFHVFARAAALRSKRALQAGCSLRTRLLADWPSRGAPRWCRPGGGEPRGGLCSQDGATCCPVTCPPHVVLSLGCHPYEDAVRR